MDMREQKFGIEVEMTGLTREAAARVIAECIDGRSRYFGGPYSAYYVTDRQDREWKVMFDSSISAQRSNGRPADESYKVEVVSPICEYRDIPVIQEIVRQLRHKKAIVNESCGIHIHINAAPYTAKTLRNLTNIMASKEDLIYKALQVSVRREDQYCKKVDMDFLEELNRKKPQSLEDVSRIWYKGRDGSQRHYDASRYHCLNLHSVFQKGTVEFRLFNSTTHAGKVKTYIQFCLAISNQALSQKSASRAKTQSTNEKYTFRTWLLRLGMIGDEFETARKFLLENLEGMIAWREPGQAERQRERLRQERLRPEQMREEQIGPEQMRQEQIGPEQMRQEQIRQGQIGPERISREQNNDEQERATVEEAAAEGDLEVSAEVGDSPELNPAGSIMTMSM